MSPSKHVIELRKIIGEYAFTLEEIPEIEIKVKLFQFVNDSNKMIYFTTSHYIKTPNVCGAYISNVNYGTNEELALQRAIDTFVNLYDDAIRLGETPNDDWLIPNECY